jgi:hypothetical protein
MQQLRAIFYRRMVNSEDEETQKKGIVLIMYKSAQSFDRVLIWKIGRLLSCLPVRFMAYHMCFDSDEYNRIAPIVALGRMAVNVFDRHRFRVHTGGTMELNYVLQTFGIPVSNMPIDANGYMSSDHDRNFWSNRLNAERAQHASTTGSGPLTAAVVSSGLEGMDVTTQVATPGNNDVLLGRGKSFQDHAGYGSTTVFFDSLVAFYSCRHQCNSLRRIHFSVCAFPRLQKYPFPIFD